MDSKLGIYIRVSSQKQVEEGHSLEWQELELTKYAADNNLNIENIYIEKGISGDTIEKRPQMLKLIDDINSKKINHVLVYKIDRLGRSSLTNAIIGNILSKNNCLLTTSAFGNIDLEKAYGKLMYNIFSAISQFEVNNLSERVKNGKKQRVRNGYYNNSHNVYGYDNCYDIITGIRLLKVNQYEKLNIEKIYNMYLDGISINNIANYLTKEKVPTKRGGKWYQSTIKQILTNKLYIGIVVYNPNEKDSFENVGKHEALIDKAIFYKVQSIIEERKISKKKKLLGVYSYFAFKLKTEDNSELTFKSKQTKNKNKESIRYYCKDNIIPSIKHYELEKKFIEELSKIKISITEDLIVDLFKTNDYRLIEGILITFKKERESFLDLYSSKFITQEELKNRLFMIEKKENDFNIKLKELKNKNTIFNSDMKLKINDLFERPLSESFIKLTKEDKQNFVNLFVDNININKQHDIKIIWKGKCSN